MKTITKYSNRKLYDRETSKYISMYELLKFPVGSFKVITHNTNVDITLDTVLGALAGSRDTNEEKIEVLKQITATTVTQ